MGKTTVLLRVSVEQHAGQRALGRRAGRLRWVGRLATLLAGVVGVVTAAPTTAAASPAMMLSDHVARALPVNEQVDYVALGDSYSSGVGTGVYDGASGDCFRSPLSYPPLWAGENQPASFGFVACSGARTDDVLANQIPALQTSTDLVTITIGGNDAEFGTVLRTCTAAQSDSTCFAAVDAAEAFSRTVLPGRLARTYEAIRRDAPDARVIVLGYPRLFDLTPSCADPLVPNLARRQRLNDGADVLNTVIQKAVSQHPGFSFTDVRGRFDGHGVCSADPWINGPSVPTVVGPYHPNQTGYREGYLDALDAATGRAAEAA
ncbi:MAG: SGNH/GDSL hydrolase family protein [Pseudonocardiaceae bacterium]